MSAAVTDLEALARDTLRRMRRELERSRINAPHLADAIERNLERTSADFRAAIAFARSLAG